MQQPIQHENFGPAEYDFDLDFDLDLSATEYLGVALYFIFVAPVVFVAGLGETLARRIRGATGHDRHEAQPGSKPIHSVVTRIF